jgi:hypothetical protein
VVVAEEEEEEVYDPFHGHNDVCVAAVATGAAGAGAGAGTNIVFGKNARRGEIEPLPMSASSPVPPRCRPDAAPMTPGSGLPASFLPSFVSLSGGRGEAKRTVEARRPGETWPRDAAPLVISRPDVNRSPSFSPIVSRPRLVGHSRRATPTMRVEGENGRGL